MSNAIPLFQKAHAQDADIPLRFITVYTPHPTMFSRWQPRSLTSDPYDRYQWDISYPESILGPLNAYKDKMIVLDGFDYRVAYQKGTSGHWAVNSALTGVTNQGNDPHPDHCIQGSIDQHIAGLTASDYPITSIETGIEYYLRTNCFLPGGTRLPQDPNPLNLFTRLFGQQNQSSDELAKQLLRQQSSLDFAKAEFDAIMGSASNQGRELLEIHLDSLRGIERRLGSSLVCTAPTAPQSFSRSMIATHGDVMLQAQMDLSVRALACRQTRVVNLMISPQQLNFVPEIANLNAHNDIAHTLGIQPEANEALTDIQARTYHLHRWYTEQIKYLMDKLAEVPEGNGTMLDHTLIFCFNELGQGHGNLNVPMVILGGCGGKLRMGQWIKMSQGFTADCTYRYAEDQCPADTADTTSMMSAHNPVLTTILRAFGQNADSFGDPDFPGIIDGLLV